MLSLLWGRDTCHQARAIRAISSSYVEDALRIFQDTDLGSGLLERGLEHQFGRALLYCCWVGLGA